MTKKSYQRYWLVAPAIGRRTFLVNDEWGVQTISNSIDRIFLLFTPKIISIDSFIIETRFDDRHHF